MLNMQQHFTFLSVVGDKSWTVIYDLVSMRVRKNMKSLHLILHVPRNRHTSDVLSITRAIPFEILRVKNGNQK